MIPCRVGIIPLIRDICEEHPGVTKPWYPDNAGYGGEFRRIKYHLEALMQKGPSRGYLPDLTKSILVVSDFNVPWDK